ncbi:MAG: AAA family ATPase [archaeon]
MSRSINSTKPAKRGKPLTLVITGTPGTGKTQLAQFLKKKMKFHVLEEKSLIQKHGIGTWDKEMNEWDVDVQHLKKAILQELKKIKKSTLIVGHLSCEISLPVNGVIVLKTPVKELEKRLRARKYSEVKIQDNLFCEETKYVEIRVRKHYAGKPIRVISTGRPKKVVNDTIGAWIKAHIRT